MTGFELAKEQNDLLGKTMVLVLDACKHGVPGFDNLDEETKKNIVEKYVYKIYGV